MFNMLVDGLAIDEYINEDHHELVQMRVEDDSHQMHECCRRIRETKGHVSCLK